MKKLLYLVFISVLTLTSNVFALEDYIVATDGKISDIRIQYNDIIDVCPLITIMNEKNVLFVHPLKTGTTKFSIIKNDKDKFIFNVNVADDSTTIEPVDGFDIFGIDYPPGTFSFQFDLDLPPTESSVPESKYFPPELRGIN